MTSCRRDIMTSDTSGLYDYPFNFLIVYNAVRIKLQLNSDNAPKKQ